MAGRFTQKPDEAVESDQIENKEITRATMTAILTVAEKSAPAKLNAALQEMKPADTIRLRNAALADNAVEFRDILRPQFANANDHAKFPEYREWFKANEQLVVQETSKQLRLEARDAIVQNDLKSAPALIKATYEYDKTNGFTVEQTTAGIMTAQMAKDDETRAFFLKAVYQSGLSDETVQSIMKYLDKQYNTDIYAQILSGNNQGIPAEVRRERNKFVEEMRAELDRFEKLAAGNPKLQGNVETIREGLNNPSQVDAIDAALKSSYASRIELSILDGPEHARLAAMVPKRKFA